MTEPYWPAWLPTGPVSARGMRHGSTITGTSWKRSARYCAEPSTGDSGLPAARSSIALR